MQSFLALLAYITAAGLSVEHARIPAGPGVTLDAALVQPAGPGGGPAVIGLHGCDGPNANRDGGWAVLLARQGHAVLLPDSFGSRGLDGQCREPNRTVHPDPHRRADAIAAGEWLRDKGRLAAAGIVLLGWSHGGATVLATARDGQANALFQRYVAFYPGCGASARDAQWRPAAPILIMIGDADDWTPAAPCQRLAPRFPAMIELIVYPGAYHGFDVPNRPIRQLTGIASTRSGTAMVGTDPAARQDALTRVPAFINAGR
jgi:dienelactone hydrolase